MVSRHLLAVSVTSHSITIVNDFRTSILFTTFNIGSVNMLNMEIFADDNLRTHFFELSQDLMCVVDFNGYFKYVNPVWEKLLGYTQEELCSKSFLDYTHLEDRQQNEDAIFNVLNGMNNISFENRLISKDTSIKCIQWTVSFDVNEKVMFFLGKDITESKLREKDLQSTNEHLNAIIEVAPAAIIGFNEDGKVHGVWNKAAEKMLGWSAEEALGNFLPIIAWDKQEEFHTFSELIRSGKMLNGIDVQQQRKDGLLMDYCIYVSPLHRPDGQMEGNIAVLVDITERKQSEQALKESEERLQLVIKGSNDASWDWDFAKKKMYYSPQWWSQIGYKPNELIANDQLWYTLTHPDDRENINATFDNALKTNVESYELEFRLKHKNGHYVPVLSRGILTRDKDGNLIRLTGTNMDLTERKKVGEVIRRSEAKFKELFNKSVTPLGLLNKKSAKLEFNEKFGTTFGYTKEDIPTINEWLQLAYPDPVYRKEVVDTWEASLNEALEQKCDLKPHEYHITCKNGDVRDMVLSGSSIDNDWLVTFYDITERKQIEIELQTNYNRYKKAQAMGHVGNWEYDLNTAIFWGSDEAKRIFGFKPFPKDLTTERVESCIPDRVLVHQALVDLLEQGKKYNLVYDILTEDKGIRKTLHSIAEVEKDRMGNPQKVTGVVSDITEQNRVERKLEDSEKKHRAYIENAPLGIFVADSKGKYIDVNPGACRLLGYTQDELLKLSISDVLISEKGTIAFQRLKKEGIIRSEAELEKKDGSIVHVRLDGVSLPNNQFMAFCVNIDELKQHQIDLLKAKEKAEESDRLKSAFLANMSHEIRTPMNGILGFTNLLKEPELTGKEQEEYISIIEKSGERMLNTINDIIDISKIESRQVDVIISDVNLNKLLEELLEFFLPEAKCKGVSLFITNELPDQPGNFKSDQYKLNSILTNFIKNAIKFTHSGSIEFGYTIEESGHQEKLEFFVKDTGIGIPKERQGVVFERFIRVDIESKQIYEGSGLGLAISKAYAEMLGGRIWMKSEEGVGSQFYFTMPCDVHKSEMMNNNLEE